MQHIVVRNPHQIWHDEDWNEFFSHFASNSFGPNHINLYETEDMVVVEMLAPGFTAEQVDISIEDNRLTVSGKYERQEQEEVKDKKYYHQEIQRQSFTRTVALPVRVDGDKAEATFVDGIIKVAMPKAEEVKPKKIAIKAK